MGLRSENKIEKTNSDFGGISTGTTLNLKELEVETF